MKTIASIDCNFRTRFLGQSFKIVRIGTDNDPKAAEQLIHDWRDRVDEIGLGMVHDHFTVPKGAGSHQIISLPAINLATSSSP
jgi:hypothetical protein